MIEKNKANVIMSGTKMLLTVAFCLTFPFLQLGTYDNVVISYERIIILLAVHISLQPLHSTVLLVSLWIMRYPVLSR